MNKHKLNINLKICYKFMNETIKTELFQYDNTFDCEYITDNLLKITNCRPIEKDLKIKTGRYIRISPHICDNVLYGHTTLNVNEHRLYQIDKLLN